MSVRPKPHTPNPETCAELAGPQPPPPKKKKKNPFPALSWIGRAISESANPRVRGGASRGFWLVCSVHCRVWRYRNQTPRSQRCCSHLSDMMLGIPLICLVDEWVLTNHGERLESPLTAFLGRGLFGLRRLRGCLWKLSRSGR